MNEHKQHMTKVTRNVMVMDMLAGVMHQLAEQEYVDCLKAIAGERLSTGKEEFTVNYVDDHWTITQHGIFDWTLSFQFGEDFTNNEHRWYIQNVRVLQMGALDTTISIVKDLFEIVVMILTTYHPGGRPLEFPTSEA